MRIYVKNGKLFIADVGDRDKLEIKSDNEIISLDTDFSHSDWNNVEATALDEIGNEIEGVDIRNYI